MMHTTADDPKRYRTEEEVETWKKRDPLSRFQKYLQDKGHLSAKKIEGLEEKVKVEIQSAVDHAETQMKEGGDPMDMFDHAYAELPPYLMEQREELRNELAAIKEENHG